MILKEAKVKYGVALRGLDKNAVVLDAAEKVAALAWEHWKENLSLDVESAVVFLLNRKNRVQSVVTISTGTTGATLMGCKEVFRVAVMELANSIIVVHNHPSGDPSPSAADTNVTRKLREASKILEIDILDHVVIGDPACDPSGLGYFSYREAGIL